MMFLWGEPVIYVHPCRARNGKWEVETRWTGDVPNLIFGGTVYPHAGYTLVDFWIAPLVTIRVIRTLD